MGGRREGGLNRAQLLAIFYPRGVVVVAGASCVESSGSGWSSGLAGVTFYIPQVLAGLGRLRLQSPGTSLVG